MRVLLKLLGCYLDIDLLAEIERREILAKAIEGIIDAQFVRKEGAKLKRGQAQEKIFKILGVRRNNVLCGIVNDCFRARGFLTVINRGDNYYRNVSLLPNQCA